jgi:hypothetical protein
MTYTVTAYLEEARAIADRGRHKIAEMVGLGWPAQAYNTIKEQMNQADAYTACKVFIIFLVDGLGSHFMLTV